MAATEVSVTDAARHFSDVINRVSYRGERFVLCKGNRPVAELNPVAAGRSWKEWQGLLARLPALGEAEVEALEDELEALRRNEAGVKGQAWLF